MWTVADQQLESRLFFGTAQFPSPEILKDSVTASAAEVVTFALRRQNPARNAGSPFWEIIRSMNVRVLPNTAGCRTAREAVVTAQMARELFDTHWVKLEVIGDEYTLEPEPRGLVEAARTLCADGFEVFPYMTEDPALAEDLVEAGCRILMPWGSPIGSGQGLANPEGLAQLRERFPDQVLVVDAGLGKPSHAAEAMELGYDAVLVNSAMALAQDPAKMARAFADGVEAGRRAFEAGPMPRRDMASPSTPTIGTPFWHQVDDQP